MGRCITEYECLGTAAYVHACRSLIAPPYTLGAFNGFGYKLEKINPLFAPTITSVKKKNGAIAMFYPGVLEKLGRNLWQEVIMYHLQVFTMYDSPCITVQPETDSSFFKRCK